MGNVKYPKHHGMNAFTSSRPSLVDRRGSRTDMATGIRGVHRGFDFATEERGVTIQRIQTDLSERRLSKLDVRGRDKGRGHGKGGSALRIFSRGRKSRNTQNRDETQS